MSHEQKRLQDLGRDLPDSPEAIIATVLERAEQLRDEGYGKQVLERLRELRNDWFNQADLWLSLKATESILAFLAADLAGAEYEVELDYLSGLADLDLRPTLTRLKPQLSVDLLESESEQLRQQIREFVQVQKTNAKSYFERERMIRNRALSAELSANLRALQMTVESFAYEHGAYPCSLDAEAFLQSGALPCSRIDPYSGKEQVYSSRLAYSNDSDELLFCKKLPLGQIEYLYIEDLAAYIIRAYCCHSQFVYASLNATDFVNQRMPNLGLSRAASE